MAPEDLVRAVRAVAEGGLYLDPSVAGKALAETAATEKAAAADAVLSPREADVLRFTAQGFSNKEIAIRLEVGVKTVETYKARASDKLGLRSRVARCWLRAAAAWVVRAGPPRMPRGGRRRRTAVMGIAGPGNGRLAACVGDRP